MSDSKKDALRGEYQAKVNDYLKSLECEEPTRPGLYLRLLHGREHPDQDLDHWGKDGPFFGPLSSFHSTYLSTFHITAASDEPGAGHLCDGNLCPVKDLVYYNGMFYGDMSLFMHRGDEVDALEKTP